MRNSQIIMLLLLGTICTAAVILTLLSFGIMGGPGVAAVAEVPAGCQEIAFLVPATSMDIWERMVGALVRTKRLWSKRHADLRPLDFDTSEAFPQQSAAVPQFALWLGDPAHGKLLVRWYKISGEKSVEDWIGALSRRSTPPLAIIGGENTERATNISTALVNHRQHWQGSAPLFLITTATADSLIELYPQRNYRFSFANSAMARSVLDFVSEHPDELWPTHPFDVRVVGAMVGSTNILSTTIFLQLEQKVLNYAMLAVGWKDDPYSVDLSHRFLYEFQKRYYGSPGAEQGPDPELVSSDQIAYSTGDFNNANYWESFSALQFATNRNKSPTIRQILVLPTGTDRARRYLKAVISGDPDGVHNLAVVSGDSITFNQIYRDRKVAWNILDMPVPLVFFSHRNPVYRDVGDSDGKYQGFLEQGTEARPWATTGMQDLLLHRDVLEAVIVAAYHGDALTDNADDLDRQLGQLRWLPIRNQDGKIVDGHVTYTADNEPLFDANRNRREGTGEHVVLLQPQRDQHGLLQPEAIITLWSRTTQAGLHQDWQQAAILPKVYYADARPE
jgi:hypothetical protein